MGSTREPAWVSSSGAPARIPVWEVPGWGTVRAALALLAVGQILTYAAIVIPFLLSKSIKGGEEPSAALLLTLLVDFGALLPGGIAFCVAGMFMSLAVPADSGAKGWARVVAFCLVVGGIVLLIRAYGPLANERHRASERRAVQDRLTELRKEMAKAAAQRDAERLQELQKKASRFGAEKEPEPPWSPGVLKGLNYAYQIALILAGYFFLAFLWAVARRLGRPGLAVSILFYLVVCIVVGGGTYALTIVAEKNQSVAKFFTGDWVWGWMAVMGVCCLWTDIHLYLVRGAVTRALRS
jgi:drug/metabolite transporter (DMT)-like permease